MKTIDPEQYTKALGEVMEKYYQSKDDAVDAAAEIDTRQTAAEVDISDLQAEVARLNSGKQATLTFDSAPTENSNNPVTSGGVYAALQNVTADEVDWSSVENKPTTLAGYGVTATDPLLVGKADNATVTAALADKADSSVVTAALADKADKTTVTNALAQKANATDLTSKEDKSNRVTTIPQNATDTTYPTAGAVRRLFDSIVNGDEVSF